MHFCGLQYEGPVSDPISSLRSCFCFLLVIPVLRKIRLVSVYEARLQKAQGNITLGAGVKKVASPLESFSLHHACTHLSRLNHIYLLLQSDHHLSSTWAFPFRRLAPEEMLSFPEAPEGGQSRDSYICT